MNARKILFIAAGVVALLILGTVLYFSLTPGKNQEALRRENTIKLAADYGAHGDYQRALDLLDGLLIQNASDTQAMALRDQLLQDQQNQKKQSQENQLNALQNVNDQLKNSLNTLSSRLETRGQNALSGGNEAALERAQQRVEAQKEEKARLEREKAESSRLTEAQKAQQKLIDEGISLMNEGKYPQAKAKFDQVLNQDPRNASANVRKGEAEFLQDPQNPDHRQKALDALSLGLASNPNDAHGFAVRGDVYAASKNWSAALQDYQTSLKIDPNNAGVWYALGKAYFIVRRYEEALEAFQTSLKYDPTNALAYNAVGSSYAQLGQDRKAQNAFSRAVHLKPDFALAHFQLARTLANQGKIESALKSFETAARLDPQSVAFLSGFGTALYDAGRYKDAESQFAAAVVLNNQRADLYHDLSTCQLQLGEINQALENEQKAVSMDSTVPEYYFNLGQCLEKAGSPDLALTAYQNAIQLKADYSAPRVQIALILEKKGDLDGAMSQLLKAYDSTPTNAAVVNNLGRIYLLKKLSSQAIDFFRKALASKNDTPDIRYNLALAYIDAGQKDLAKSVLQDLVKLSPHYWDGWYQLGSLLYDMGDLEGGKKVYRELLSQDPGYPKAPQIEGILAK
ncbi:MAG: tetratricopeptide repeat protein [Spirochaetales bacterium]|nr:tetratricopeptide repeat protein [Spirochaetales bacterium]